MLENNEATFNVSWSEVDQDIGQVLGRDGPPVSKVDPVRQDPGQPL